MDFVFTGFKQNQNFRQYAFEGIAEDRSRTAFVVGADLMLIRKYQITMQELPLLCLRLLEGNPGGSHAVTFTEEDMRSYATNRTAAKDLAASRRKPVRRPASPTAGSAWRGPANVV
jgi:hypothetical protein